LIKENTDNKILHLEGLRGILAIIVVINHFILLFYPVYFIGSFDLKDFINSPSSYKILLANTPANIFMNGSFAVCAFFGISGYVLTLSYKKSNELKTLQKNILKRYVRLIIPVIATCLLIYLLFVSGAFTKANYPANSPNLDFGQSLFKNDLSFLRMIKMALFNVPFSGNNLYLSVLWTIQIEFLGVLVLFAFLMFTHGLRKRWVYGIIVILACILLTRYYVPLLFAGSIICIYEERIRSFLTRRSVKIFLLLVFLFFAGVPNIANEAKIHTMYSFTTVFPFNVYPYFHNIATVFLLLLIISSKSIKKVLSSKNLVRLGSLSFSVYLIHLPILYCFGTYLMRMFKGDIPVVALFLICFCAIIIFSVLFYLFIDRPAIAISNKLAKKFIPEATPLMQAAN